MDKILIFCLLAIIAFGFGIWLDYRDSKRENDKLFNKKEK